MKRVLTLVGALLTCVPLVGCGTDERAGLVATTVTQLEDAATKVANIKRKLDEAVKKTKVGENPDFKDVNAEVDSLKKIAKQMQELKLKADALKEKTTAEEREELKKYRGNVNTAIDRLSTSRKELNETLIAAEEHHKEALKAVRDKLQEAEGEFAAIARR
jgi:chromosome segregation ATPase